jgi:hypothetical protein
VGRTTAALTLGGNPSQFRLLERVIFGPGSTEFFRKVLSRWEDRCYFSGVPSLRGAPGCASYHFYEYVAGS